MRGERRGFNVGGDGRERTGDGGGEVVRDGD